MGGWGEGEECRRRMRFALAVKLISPAAPTAITATMTILRLRGRYAPNLIALHTTTTTTGGIYISTVLVIRILHCVQRETYNA